MPEKSSLSSLSSSSSCVSQIFRSMSYNEEEGEDLSPIYTWLSPRNAISSIFNGEWTTTTNSSNLVVELEKTSIRVDFASPELLEQSLHSDSKSSQQENQVNETDFQKRLEQLRSLVKSKSRVLSLLESFAVETPVWQVVQFDVKFWEKAMNHSSELPALAKEHQLKSNILIIPLNRETYSLDKIISRVFIPSLESDGKFQVILSISNAQHAACSLPIAFAVDVFNKSNIRKSPIDLLLLDRSSEESLKVLKRKSSECSIFVRGESWAELELESESKSVSGLPQFPLDLHLFSGVFRSESGVKGTHFIVDSSADVQTAAEAISANVWTSGTKVKSGSRSLLLVHQSVYKVLMEALEKKMTQLKISTDFTLKMADFIKRPLPSIHAQKVLTQGVKVFPEGSDLSSPALVYDIGTSSRLITGATPGTGHILALISYRNTAELVQLSNNLDNGNQVLIYATDVSFVKQAAAGLKGKDIWLNRADGGQNWRNDVDESNNHPIAILTDRISEQEEELLNSTGKRTPSSGQDKFMAVVGGAEKCLKSWSSLTISRRSALLEKILSSIPENQISSLNKAEYSSLLIKIAGRIATSGDDIDGNNLSSRLFQPCGSVVILFSGTGTGTTNLNTWTRLMPVFVSALKGNVTTVISVGSNEQRTSKEEEEGIKSAIQSGLPVGVVNWIELDSVSESLGLVTRHGKINVLWLIHDHTDSTLSLQQIPITAFQRVVIDTGNLTKTQIIQRASQLENTQTVHF